MESRPANNASSTSKGERTHSPFSPTQHSVMNNFFNTKGPIKPPSTSGDQAMAIQSMINQQHRGMQGHQHYDYYDEEDDNPDPRNHPQMANIEDISEGDSQQRSTNNRQLSPEEEEMILGELLYSAQDNREFMKVLHILQNDPELRPLIFEHESLLRTLKDMRELKAEQMLSILTAAETEMYESSKKNEELIQQQRQLNNRPMPSEHKQVEANLGGGEADLLKKLQKEHDQLKQQVQQLKADNENIMLQMQNERQKLVKQIQQKEAQLKEEKAQNLLLQTQIKENQAAKKADGDLKQLESRLTEMQRQLEASKASDAQKQKRLDAAENEKKGLVTQIEALQKQAELSDSQNQKLSRKIKDLYS